MRQYEALGVGDLDLTEKVRGIIINTRVGDTKIPIPHTVD